LADDHVGAISTLITTRYSIAVADNLHARRIHTQTQVLQRIVIVCIIVVTIVVMLMTIPSARQIGTSVFASAGIAGVIVGMAARSTFASLIAGLQVAITQPIRIDDAVVVEGELGWIEEIESTYVVVRLWDLRRLIVPLTYFIEKPLQYWTRTTAGCRHGVHLRTTPAGGNSARRERISLQESNCGNGKRVYCRLRSLPKHHAVALLDERQLVFDRVRPALPCARTEIKFCRTITAVPADSPRRGHLQPVDATVTKSFNRCCSLRVFRNCSEAPG
jgi:hypothetical protein